MLAKAKMEREKRIEKGHEDLGLYKIVVSKVLDRLSAAKLTESFNTMPSSLPYNKLFKRFKYSLDGKLQGYIVKRKVLVGDKVGFLETDVSFLGVPPIQMPPNT